jgi:hypothetical protein
MVKPNRIAFDAAAFWRKPELDEESLLGSLLSSAVYGGELDGIFPTRDVHDVTDPPAPNVATSGIRLAADRMYRRSRLSNEFTWGQPSNMRESRPTTNAQKSSIAGRP